LIPALTKPSVTYIYYKEISFFFCLTFSKLLQQTGERTHFERGVACLDYLISSKLSKNKTTRDGTRVDHTFASAAIIYEPLFAWSFQLKGGAKKTLTKLNFVLMISPLKDNYLHIKWGRDKNFRVSIIF
jgi:hypothetical protein